MCASPSGTQLYFPFAIPLRQDAFEIADHFLLQIH